MNNSFQKEKGVSENFGDMQWRELAGAVARKG